LSWILVSRNDFYAGDSVARLLRAISLLAFKLQQFELDSDSEVVIVDYGSHTTLQDEPRFKKWLSMLHPGMTVRVAVIDPKTAEEIAPVSVSEVHGLNYAARNARGKMVLRIDQDTVVGDEFMRWVAMQKLNHWPDDIMHSAWWCGRRDLGIESTTVLMGLDTHNAAAFLQKNGHLQPFFAIRAPSASYLHSAVGVMAIPRAVWHSVQGYDETQVHWGGMENGLLDKVSQHTSVLYPCLQMCPQDPFYHLSHEKDARIHDQPEASQKSNKHWGLIQRNAQISVLECPAAGIVKPGPTLRQVDLETSRSSCQPHGSKDIRFSKHKGVIVVKVPWQQETASLETVPVTVPTKLA
jgi:hypothetical protein